VTIARDVVDLVTGRRPGVRNRVKFFLLSPIYDGFYRFLPASLHTEIVHRIAPGARRVLDLCTGTARVDQLRDAGFAVERTPPSGWMPMQVVLARA